MVDGDSFDVLRVMVVEAIALAEISYEFALLEPQKVTFA
jgi:hypothetical protein